MAGGGADGGYACWVEGMPATRDREKVAEEIRRCFRQYLVEIQR